MLTRCSKSNMSNSLNLIEHVVIEHVVIFTISWIIFANRKENSPCGCPHEKSSSAPESAIFFAFCMSVCAKIV